MIGAPSSAAPHTVGNTRASLVVATRLAEGLSSEGSGRLALEARELGQLALVAAAASRLAEGLSSEGSGRLALEARELRQLALVFVEEALEERFGLLGLVEDGRVVVPYLVRCGGAPD